MLSFADAKEVTQILKTFHGATEIVSGEKYPTIAIVHPQTSLSDAQGGLVKQVKAAVSLNLKNGIRMMTFRN